MSRARRVARGIAGAALFLVPVAVVAGLFLSRYETEDFASPMGFDTPKYLWRANLVASQGLDALPGSVPRGETSNPDRPGLPALLGLLEAASGLDPYQAMFVLSPVLAALVALGAGVLALEGMGEPRWSFPMYAVAVGASANIGFTAIGYADNMVVGAIVVGAGTTSLLVADGERGMIATGVLLTGATLVHWSFALTFAAVLGALTLVLTPSAIAAHRRGEAFSSLPAARLGMTLAGSALAAGAAMALLPARPAPPQVMGAAFVTKYRERASYYLLPVTGALAALGVLALAIPRDPRKRRGLALLVIWALTGALAVLLLVALDRMIPAHRILGFALGIPFLGAAAVTALATLAVSHLRVAGVVLASALLVAAAAGGAVMGHAAWSTGRSWVSEQHRTQGLVAGAYLEAVGNSGPAVFVINPFSARTNPKLTFHSIRSAMPGDQIRNVHLYLGKPALLLAGQPTVREGKDGYNRVSLRLWRQVEPVLSREPIMLFLPGYNRGLGPASHPDDADLPEGIAILQGPPAPEELSVPAVERPRLAALMWWAALLLAVLAVAGSGWSAALLPGRWTLRAALAPALGMAALVIGGVLADRVGLRLVGSQGAVTALAVTALGWAALVVRRRAGRHRPVDRLG